MELLGGQGFVIFVVGYQLRVLGQQELQALQVLRLDGVDLLQNLPVDELLAGRLSARPLVHPFVRPVHGVHHLLEVRDALLRGEVQLLPLLNIHSELGEELVDGGILLESHRWVEGF